MSGPSPSANTTNPPPVLSVTVLNYNYGRYLPACLDSILAQTFRDFEVVVIDDRSTDESLEIVKPYLEDPRVRLVSHEKNSGYRSSLIEGTEQYSRGEFLMVISADDRVARSDAFERQLALIHRHADAAFCFSSYERFDDATDAVLETQHSYQGDQLLEGERFFRDYTTRQFVQVLHSGTMIRRSAYEKSGGYRRDLGICLDFAMWLVLALEGPVAYCDDTLYAYRSHATQMSQSFKKVHTNAKECVSAVEVACARARERGLAIHEIREEAIQYILFAIAIDDAFSGRTTLAISRSVSALVLEPRLTLASSGLPIVIARLVLGESGYELARSMVRPESKSAPGAPDDAPEVQPRPVPPPDAHGLGVVLMINSIMMGGAEEHVRRLALGLRARGAEVTVVVPETREVDQLAQALTDVRIPVERLTLALGTEGKGVIPRALELVALLRRKRPRVFHLHLIGYTGGRWAVWAARLSGVQKLVCTLHIAPTERQPLRVRVDRAIQASLVDRFVAVSKANAVSFRNELGLPSSKLSVVPNSVDLAGWGGDREHDRRTIREEFRIPHDATVVGAIARLDVQKGLTYLIRALPEVVLSHPHVHLLLAGDGPLRGELEEQARSLGLAERVHFAGFRRDTRAILSTLDIAALPSVHEGLPLSLLEAMAAELPIVATRVGGMPEVISDGSTGLLVPAQDPSALALAIRRLLDEPSMARRLAAAARARCADFSEDALVDRLLGVYLDTESR